MIFIARKAHQGTSSVLFTQVKSLAAPYPDISAVVVEKGLTHVFNTPKIVYPVICKEARFTLDEQGYFSNDKTFIIPVNDLYLLGILNSKPVWEFLKTICSTLGDSDKGGRLELRSIYVSKIPIPITADAQKTKIEFLVKNCLASKGLECEKYETEIDELVASFYLTFR